MWRLDGPLSRKRSLYIPRLGGPRAEIVPGLEASEAPLRIRYREGVRRVYQETTYPNHRDVVGTWVCEAWVKTRGEDKMTRGRRVFVVSDTSKSQGGKVSLGVASTGLTSRFWIQVHMRLLSWFIWK